MMAVGHDIAVSTNPTSLPTLAAADTKESLGLASDINRVPAPSTPHALQVVTQSSNQDVALKGPSTSINRLTDSTFLSLCLLGGATSLGWNILVNTLPSLRSGLYRTNSSNFSAPITATYNLLVVMSSLMLTLVGALNPIFVHGGLVGVLLCLAAMLIACFVIKAPSAGALTLSFVGGGLGIFGAMGVGGALAYASVLPGNPADGVCIGTGLAGVLSFTLWMFISKLVFSGDSTGVQSSVLIFLTCGSILCVLSIVTSHIYITQPYTSQSRGQESLGTAPESCSANDEEVRPASESPRDGKGKVVAEASPSHWSVEQTPVLPPRGSSDCDFTKSTVDTAPIDRDPESLHCSAKFDRGEALRRSWVVILYLFVNTFTTLFLFPNIGPLAWGHKTFVTDIMVGVFQFGDLIGRALPVWLPPPLIKKLSINLIAGLVAGRILFIPLFFLPTLGAASSAAHGDLTPLLGTVEMSMVMALAVTSGLASTMGALHAVDAVDMMGTEVKSYLSSLALLASFGGAGGGSFLVSLILMLS